MNKLKLYNEKINYFKNKINYYNEKINYYTNLLKEATDDDLIYKINKYNHKIYLLNGGGDLEGIIQFSDIKAYNKPISYYNDILNTTKIRLYDFVNDIINNLKNLNKNITNREIEKIIVDGTQEITDKNYYNEIKFYKKLTVNFYNNDKELTLYIDHNDRKIKYDYSDKDESIVYR